jgi:carbon-monoxide dehydrogenase medium subunit
VYKFYHSPTSLEDVLALKAEYGDNARIIAGGTDLLLEIERGVRRAQDGSALGLIDLSRVPGLAEIQERDGWIHLGPLVTHNQCVASPVIVQRAFPLARACWEVGAPQIRNRATVAGNIITASPANDAIVPLMALNATVTVSSAARGSRTMPLAQFVTGFRQVDMAPDEVLTAISFPVMDAAQRGSFIKLGLRRTQAISVVSVAAVLTFADDGVTISSAAISLGAVAPVIVRAQAAETFLQGKALSEDTIQEAARLALTAASPIDDVRGSAEYRRGMVETLTARILRQLRDGRERDGWPERPVLLWGRTQGKWPVAPAGKAGASTQAIVNGRAVQLPGGLTLLDSLREAGLVGVKEGCAEGECGACTVFLDGMAVLSCLIPAERAVGSEVVTVEGLGDVEHLHPVQQAFVQTGGVQCGYCTPGFIMSTAKLLEERPQPDREAAEEALTGNFCRCTGYRKIIDAVVMTGNLSREGRKPHEE